MMNIFYLLLIFFSFIGFIFVFIFYLKKKIKIFLSLKKELPSLKEEITNLYSEKRILNQYLSKKESELSNTELELKDKINLLKSQTDIYEAQKQFFDADLKNYYKQQNDLELNNFNQKKEDLKLSIQEVNKEYLSILNDFSKLILEKSNELAALKEKNNIIINKNKQNLLEKEKENFYKINLTEKEISDINLLMGIEDQLFNKEILNKILWKTYYEKPTNLLIGRVLEGNKISCGIYKITNLKNQMSYIGQSVNISDRWKQHIKRGLGAEKATQNKLYIEMKKYRVENFSFEVLQICSKEKLNELEKYWIDFYQTKTFGYNSTNGNL